MAIINKIIAFFLSILAFLGINIGGGKPELPEVPDVGIAVDGGSVTVTLKSNRTTGYVWDYAYVNGQEDEVVSFESDNYVPDKTEPGIVGAGGNDVFVFTAVGEGTEIIKFSYLRPFENSLPVKTVYVKVTADSQLKATAEAVTDI